MLLVHLESLVEAKQLGALLLELALKPVYAVLRCAVLLLNLQRGVGQGGGIQGTAGGSPGNTDMRGDNSYERYRDSGAYLQYIRVLTEMGHRQESTETINKI